MENNALFRLPSDVLTRIYVFAHGDDIVDIEVNENGKNLTSGCKMLRVCRELRQTILDACQQRRLRLVYAIRSPAALVKLLSRSNLTSDRFSVRLVLLGELEGVALTVEEQLGSSYGLHVGPLFKAWREASRIGHGFESVDMVYFDLVRSFRLNPTGVGRLVHNLSAVISSRAHGTARCRVIGCRTIQGRVCVESSTVNVIPADNAAQTKRGNPRTEFEAGSHPAEDSASLGLNEQAIQEATRPRLDWELPVPRSVAGSKRKSEEISLSSYHLEPYCRYFQTAFRRCALSQSKDR